MDHLSSKSLSSDEEQPSYKLPIQKKLKLNDEQNPQSFYDKKIEATQTNRMQSRIIDLKNFQNWIKAVAINEFAKPLKDTLDRSNQLNILDLGCGKGGDLKKWQRIGIGLWTGIDISGESLKQALERYKNLRGSNRFKIYLLQGSVNQQNFNYKLPQEMYFDVVSMQFMANLLFSSEMEVNQMFENMVTRLCNNGIVFLTITDSNVLIKRMKSVGEKSDDDQYYMMNKYYQIGMENKNFDYTNAYGWKYKFYLEDSVGEKVDNKIIYVPEYMILMKAFKEKAKQYKLEVVEDLNFTEFYKKYQQKWSKLLEKMIGKENWQMEQEQWDIVHLYRVVVLKNINRQSMNQYKIKRGNHLNISQESLHL